MKFVQKLFPSAIVCKMVWPEEESAQTDETYFKAHRKYNTGRNLQQVTSLIQLKVTEVETSSNYERHIDWPWVFQLKKGTDWRYFMLGKKKELVKHLYP